MRLLAAMIFAILPVVGPAADAPKPDVVIIAPTRTGSGQIEDCLRDPVNCDDLPDLDGGLSLGIAKKNSNIMIDNSARPEPKPSIPDICLGLGKNCFNR